MPGSQVAVLHYQFPAARIVVARLCILTAEIQLRPVAALSIQMRVNVVLLPALNARRQRAVYFRAGFFFRAIAELLAVRHPHIETCRRVSWAARKMMTVPSFRSSTSLYPVSSTIPGIRCAALLNGCGRTVLLVMV